MIIDKKLNTNNMKNYFAYGSNMSYEQMKERCPGSKYLGVARLNGYKLDFTKMSTIRGGGVADIVESADDCVYGILYSITDDDLAVLDVKEKGYTRYDVDYSAQLRLIDEDFRIKR
jgi:hypothetical protein